MFSYELPLPEVTTVYLALAGREGTYYLTNGGCLFRRKPKEGEKRYPRQKEYLVQVPSDSMLVAPTYKLLYRVDHYPLMITLDGETIDCPIKLVETDLLHPKWCRWGIREYNLFDLDIVLNHFPSFGKNLERRKGPSSGAF